MYRTIGIALLSYLFAQGTLAATNQRTMGAINTITSRAEYDRIAQAQTPTVIIFNSPTCSACTLMEEALTPLAKEYVQVDFYRINATDEALKRSDKESFSKEMGLEAYPTTHFLKGSTKRVESGSMSQKEADSILYELVTGKKKPITFPKQEESPQEAPKTNTKE